MGLGKFLYLPRREQWIALKCAALLPLIWAGIRLASFNKLQQLIDRLVPVAARPGASIQSVTETVGSCSWRFGFSNNCLVRALCAYILLRQNGHSVSLKIGAAKSGEQGIIAHAWIEDADGSVVAEDVHELESYRELR